MKKICLNCEYWECCDGNGEFLTDERTYCTYPPNTARMYVRDEDSCSDWVADKQRESDIENGC